VRSIVDGHLFLSRDLAARGQFPAVDVLASTSRVMTDVVPAQHRRMAQAFIATLAAYKEAEDLIDIGAYVRGSNPHYIHRFRRLHRLHRFSVDTAHIAAWGGIARLTKPCLPICVIREIGG
jgi:flagellum-specific ATP synthase